MECPPDSLSIFLPGLERLRAPLHLNKESLVLQAENPILDSWAWTNEEEPPFRGLPPLPKVFRELSLSPSPLQEKEEQEVVKPREGSCSSFQEKISWVHRELLSLRLADRVLFYQLYTLALEIQDLKELQEEMEAFFKEEAFADNRGQVGDAETAVHFHSAAAFELTI